MFKVWTIIEKVSVHLYWDQVLKIIIIFLQKCVIVVYMIGVCAAAVYNIKPGSRTFAVAPQEKNINDDLSVAESVGLSVGYGQYGGGYGGNGGGYGGYGGYGGSPYGYSNYGGKRVFDIFSKL